MSTCKIFIKMKSTKRVLLKGDYKLVKISMIKRKMNHIRLTTIPTKFQKDKQEDNKSRVPKGKVVIRRNKHWILEIRFKSMFIITISAAILAGNLKLEGQCLSSKTYTISIHRLIQIFHIFSFDKSSIAILTGFYFIDFIVELFCDKFLCDWVIDFSETLTVSVNETFIAFIVVLNSTSTSTFEEVNFSIFFSREKPLLAS